MNTIVDTASMQQLESVRMRIASLKDQLAELRIEERQVQKQVILHVLEQIVDEVTTQDGVQPKDALLNKYVRGGPDATPVVDGATVEKLFSPLTRQNVSWPFECANCALEELRHKDQLAEELFADMICSSRGLQRTIYLWWWPSAARG